MAVRFDAAADRLLRTANTPALNSLGGLCFWVRIVTDLDTYSCFCYIGSNNYSTGDYLFVGTDSDGTTLLVDMKTTSGTGPSLSTGTWYFITIDWNWTTPQTAVRVYNTAGAQVGSTVTLSAEPGDNSRFEFGAVGTSNLDRGDIRIEAIKRWEGARPTAAELLAERLTYTPQRIANLISWYPCFGGATERLRDYSANQYTFTAGGTLTDEAGGQLVWNTQWFALPYTVTGGGGQTVAVGQVAESDTAQAVARLKTRAVGQIAETDAAQAITRLKTRSIGQVAETEIAQAITAVKTRAVGQVAESDTAQAVARLKTAAVAQAAEIDLAQALTGAKSKSVAQITETDAAQAITRNPQARLIAQAAETDLAQAAARIKTTAVAQTTETDTAQTVARLKTLLLGQATETDIAQAVTTTGEQIIPVGQVSETDAAQAVTRLKVVALGQVSETESAQAITARKSLAIAQAPESDTALALSVRKTLAIVQVAETDLAQAVTWAPKARLVGQVVETDLAQTILVLAAVSRFSLSGVSPRRLRGQAKARLKSSRMDRLR